MSIADSIEATNQGLHSRVKYLRASKRLKSTRAISNELKAWEQEDIEERYFCLSRTSIFKSERKEIPPSITEENEKYWKHQRIQSLVWHKEDRVKYYESLIYKNIFQGPGNPLNVEKDKYNCDLPLSTAYSGGPGYEPIFGYNREERITTDWDWKIQDYKREPNREDYLNEPIEQELLWVNGYNYPEYKTWDTRALTVVYQYVRAHLSEQGGCPDRIRSALFNICRNYQEITKREVPIEYIHAFPQFISTNSDISDTEIENEDLVEFEDTPFCIRFCQDCETTVTEVDLLRKRVGLKHSNYLQRSSTDSYMYLQSKRDHRSKYQLKFSSNKSI